MPYLRSFKLGETNLMGEATSVVGRWRYSEHFRDNFEAQIVDYQFLGRPYQLELDGARNELGGNWGVQLSHPYLTDLQRISWRTTMGSREDYRYFRRGDRERPAVLLQRSYADIGGVVRVGPPGRLGLVGGSLSFEDEMPGQFPTRIGFGVTERDTTLVLQSRYTRNRVTRINALAGFRNINYMRASGLASLDGSEDVRRGVELATVLGRGVKLLGGDEPDFFVSTSLYAGTGSPSAFAAIAGTVEGRKEDGSSKWDGVLASGRFATFLKPAARHTILTSLEWSGGWNQRIPFQLSFSDRDGGPRGYRESWLAGGQRIVLRLEDRIFVGHLQQFASLGIAPFVDMGKLWAGDTPFGVDTRVQLRSVCLPARVRSSAVATHLAVRYCVSPGPFQRSPAERAALQQKFHFHFLERAGGRESKSGEIGPDFCV